MSAETGLARFDTHRAAQDDENSHQTDLRTHGAREHGQLALGEPEIDIDTESRTAAEAQPNTELQIAAEEPMRADLEAALECARATIGGLHEQVAQLEVERKQLRAEIETRRGADR